MKRRKNIILILLLLVISIMTVGYSTFSSQLEINGTATITGIWDIEITNIKATNVCTDCDAGTPSFSKTDAAFDAKLKKPGDTITYEVTIENRGTIDAVLEKIDLINVGNVNEDIIFTNTNPARELGEGETTTMQITITYNPDKDENPSITTKEVLGKIIYTQK